jgi:hypothetical protein
VLAVANVAGTLVGAYVYNALGQRMQKVAANPAAGGQQQVTGNTPASGGQLLYEHIANNPALSSAYIYMGGDMLGLARSNGEYYPPTTIIWAALKPSTAAQQAPSGKPTSSRLLKYFPRCRVTIPVNHLGLVFLMIPISSGLLGLF